MPSSLILAPLTVQDTFDEPPSDDELDSEDEEDDFEDEELAGMDDTDKQEYVSSVLKIGLMIMISFMLRFHFASRN